jgi:hypothetical protein
VMSNLLNCSTQMMCPHGGQVQIITQNTKTRGGGDFLVLSSDTYVVSGCPFTIGVVYHPCVSVRWAVTALASKAVSQPTLSMDSVGLCVAADQAVQGMVQIVSTQTRVSGK